MTGFGSVLAVPGAGAARDAICDRAVAMARLSAAALTFVDVLAEEMQAPEAVGECRSRLAAMAEAARRAGVAEASEAVLHGDAAAEVIRMVLREGHDLVVASAADAADGLVQDCPCPVLVVKPEGFATPVTLDGGSGR
jgi:nucleotide-binding universal stress UspA family protein